MALCSLVAGAFIICLCLGLPNRLDSCRRRRHKLFSCWVCIISHNSVIIQSGCGALPLTHCSAIVHLFLLLDVQCVGRICFIYVLFSLVFLMWGALGWAWAFSAGEFCWLASELFMCFYLVAISILWRNTIVNIDGAKREGVSGLKSPV